MTRQNSRIISCAALAGVAGLMSGCCSTKHVADPKDITLKNALVSVAEGLNAMREAASTNQPFGLFPSDVEVTFNIAAAQDNTGELKLDLAAPAASPVTASAGGSATFHSTASRGNQITVKFTNLLIVDPANTMVGQRRDIIDLIKSLRQAGLIELKK